MLPSSKRPPRNTDDVIRTADIEVCSSSPLGGLRATARGRMATDDEQTLLYTGATKSILPPRPADAVATPSMRSPRTPDTSLRGLVRQGQEKVPQDRTNLRGSVRPRADLEDRTMLRPTSTIPPASKPVSKPPPPPKASSSRPPAMMPTPYQPIKPAHVTAVVPAASIRSASINAPGGSDVRKPAPSDPHGDPPSSVITAQTPIARPPSRFSMAAGLVAVGAVVGLIMAVVARGDADGLIDATATFVDPAHAMSERANGAAAQAAVLPSFVDTSKAGDKASCLDLGESTVSAPVVVNAAPAPKQATASEPATTSRPTPPRAAPIAYAAAVRAVRPAPHVASPPPAPVSGSTTGGWLANITPAGAGAPIARPSRATTKGSELEGAAAADALAKAQLEASLR